MTLRIHPDEVWQRLVAVRETRPRVHCITNSVAQNFTANMLLALGAVPSMTIAPDEVAEFTGRSNALLINIGTTDAERAKAIDTAIQTAKANDVPWVLDPVFAQSSSVRRQLAQRLAKTGPTLIRGNSAEFEAILGSEPTRSEIDDFTASGPATVAMTGPIDYVTDGKRSLELPFGDPLMDRVTAMGCAGTAVMAAFLGAGSDTWTDAVSALIVLGIAGAIAAQRADGPGTFSVLYLDALYSLNRQELETHMEEPRQ